MKKILSITFCTIILISMLTGCGTLTSGDIEKIAEQLTAEDIPEVEKALEEAAEASVETENPDAPKEKLTEIPVREVEEPKVSEQTEESSPMPGSSST